jgi:hypothetical protein
MQHTTSATDFLDWTTIEQLCDHVLGGRPAPEILQILKPLEVDRDEVRNFVRRAFRLMGIANIGVHNFSPWAAFGLAMAKGFLPGAWGGRIPPITAPGRHKTIDDYLAATPWPAFGRNTTMIDLGCGFPPTTTLETAARFPDWQIVGADPLFDPYLLYDRDQSYACIDQSGSVGYFQLQPGAKITSMEDYQRCRERIPVLFEQLLPKLPHDTGDKSTVEEDGSRLIRWPHKQWDSANLRMTQAGVGSEALPRANVIRCFNVLIYYGANFQRQFEKWAAAQVQEGGLVIAGANSPNGAEAYYGVYRKENDSLVEKEFAFSPDCVRALSLMPWFALQDDNTMNLRLAGLIRRLRSNAEFCAALDARMDEILKESGTLIRNADGCLASPPIPAPMEKISQVLSSFSGQLDHESFTERAAEALRSQGLRAWRNHVGHIAVDPAGL